MFDLTCDPRVERTWFLVASESVDDEPKQGSGPVVEYRVLAGDLELSGECPSLCVRVVATVAWEGV